MVWPARFPKNEHGTHIAIAGCAYGRREMFAPASKKRKVIKMNIVKLAALAALISLGVSAARADQTNVVQNIGIQLAGVQRGGPLTSRFLVATGIALANIDTRQVIQAIGAGTANTFSGRAKLVLVTPLGGGYSSIQVRDGNNTVDVSSFFAHDQLSDFVSGSVSNTFTRKNVDLDYSIQRFALASTGSASLSLQFDVNGFATETSVSGLSGVSNLDIQVSGSGQLNGNLVILQGSIEVDGSRLEVVAGGVGPAT
jgi:hypothetical protein